MSAADLRKAAEKLDGDQTLEEIAAYTHRLSDALADLLDALADLDSSDGGAVGASEIAQAIAAGSHVARLINGEV